MGEAGLARKLIQTYPQDEYCCFIYNQALIEIVALVVNEEEDVSVETVYDALEKGEMDIVIVNLSG